MRSMRYAFRSLARTPLVSLVVVVSLGLGIGANTAIFSLFHQAMLKRLPVAAPEELVLLSSPGVEKRGRKSSGNAGGQDWIFSYPMLRALETRVPGLAGYRSFAANVGFEGRTSNGEVAAVSGGYFGVLGMRPAMGRLLDEADDKGAGQAVAVLDYGFWQGRLGGRRDVLNKPLRVNAQVFTIVGVAPEGFRGVAFGEEQQVFVPLAFKPALTPGWDGRESWSDYYIYCFARLGRGVRMEQAEQEWNGVFVGALEEGAGTLRGWSAESVARFREMRLRLAEGALGHSSLRADFETPMTVLLICTGLVVLIASVNAANLMLARGVQQRRELQIRAALGASRWQMMRQVLTEALVLAGAGGVAGMLVGMWALDALVMATVGVDGSGQLFESRLDGTMLAYTAGVALAAGLLFGMYPAWAAARATVAGTLKEEAGTVSAGKGGVRLRRGLVTAQVALSMLLLIPMGLFLKSLVNLLRTDLGMRTEGVMTFIASPELNGYSFDRARQFFIETEEKLAAAPGVDWVTGSMVPLIAGNNWSTGLHVEGFPEGENVDNNSHVNHVGPGFFSKMGMALVAGREFTDADTMGAPKVAVVNEAWVEHFAKGRNPIGLRIGESRGAERDVTVVGVVKNAKYASVRGETPRLYHRPYRQIEYAGRLAFYVQGRLPEGQMTGHIRRVMAGIDPDLPVEALQTFRAHVNQNIQGDRMTLVLAAAFAGLATVLAMLGLYGVVAFGVARRTREIGIRMAMGAAGAEIRGMVFREAGWILVLGAAAGVPGALALARLAESQLYGVGAFDAGVVAGAVAALTAAAAMAAWAPARRAARVSPIEALRYE